MYLKNINLGSPRSLFRSSKVHNLLAETIYARVLMGPYRRVRNGPEMRQSWIASEGVCGDQLLGFSIFCPQRVPHPQRNTHGRRNVWVGSWTSVYQIPVFRVRTQPCRLHRSRRVGWFLSQHLTVTSTTFPIVLDEARHCKAPPEKPEGGAVVCALRGVHPFHTKEISRLFSFWKNIRRMGTRVCLNR